MKWIFERFCEPRLTITIRLANDGLRPSLPHFRNLRFNEGYELKILPSWYVHGQGLSLWSGAFLRLLRSSRFQYKELATSAHRSRVHVDTFEESSESCIGHIDVSVVIPRPKGLSFAMLTWGERILRLRPKGMFFFITCKHRLLW